MTGMNLQTHSRGVIGGRKEEETNMASAAELKAILERIDRKGYPAYKETRGSYDFGRYVLSIDHVQGDPFASPSGLSIHMKGSSAGFPREYYDEKYKRIALQDSLLRQFGRQVEKISFRAKGSGKSGLVGVSRCGQEVLERSACRIAEDSGDITLHLEVGFPANGRSVNSRELIKILFDFLPQCVQKSLYYSTQDKEALKKVIELARDQEYIRRELPLRGLVAFVANGSILPRKTGVSDQPMEKATIFVSPKSMEVTMDLPCHGPIAGMGIRQGITLIVGGGYHGKSTLLKALERGVYNHIGGDGREYVIADDTAMKIRAEDSRSIKKVDISLFINDLPNGTDTRSFSTQDASGSVSQAANIVESMESGSKVLLIDEDTSATNFMIRDELMQKVVSHDKEPITPFIDRIRELYERWQISTVLVAGSCGAFFHKADCIVQMDRYVPVEITEFARKEAENYPLLPPAAAQVTEPDYHRVVRNGRLWQEDRVKVRASGRESFSINHDEVDLRLVEQLVDSEQLTALGHMVKYAGQNLFDGKRTLGETAETIWKLVQEKRMEAVLDSPHSYASMAMPRKQELYASLNRLR